MICIGKLHSVIFQNSTDSFLLNKGPEKSRGAITNEIVTMVYTIVYTILGASHNSLHNIPDSQDFVPQRECLRFKKEQRGAEISSMQNMLNSELFHDISI